MRQKKQQSAVGIFFSMFLRAIVIILGIVIFLFIIFFIVKVAKSGKDKSGQITVDESVLTDAEGHDDLITSPSTESTEAPAEQVTPSYDKHILVLNSTDTSGLAGRWCEKLSAMGYANNYAASYTAGTLDTTKIVAKVDGDGKDLLAIFPGSTYEVGDVTEGADESSEGYDIIVIIGRSDDDGGATDSAE